MLLLLIAMAGCSNRQSEQTERLPGIRVAEEALRSGSPQIALQVAQGLLSRNPTNVPALLAQGDAQTQLSRLDDAGKSFELALKAEPASVHAKIGLGRVRLATNPAEAEDLFLDVLRQEPRNPNAWNNLGIARDLLGRHTEAQEAYREVEPITAEMPAAKVNLALSLAISGDTVAALRIIEPLAAAPDASLKLRHDYAAILALAGRDSEAEDILRKDLSNDEVRQAMDAFRQQRRGAPDNAPVSPGPASPPAAGKRPVSDAAPARTLVELGLYPSEDAAKAKWHALRMKLPDLFAGHRPRTDLKPQDGKPRWRLVADGFSDQGSVREFCEKLHAIRATCHLARA